MIYHASILLPTVALLLLKQPFLCHLQSVLKQNLLRWMPLRVFKSAESMKYNRNRVYDVKKLLFRYCRGFLSRPTLTTRRQLDDIRDRQLSMRQSSVSKVSTRLTITSNICVSTTCRSVKSRADRITRLLSPTTGAFPPLWDCVRREFLAPVRRPRNP